MDLSCPPPPPVPFVTSGHGILFQGMGDETVAKAAGKTDRRNRRRGQVIRWHPDRCYQAERGG